MMTRTRRRRPERGPIDRIARLQDIDGERAFIAAVVADALERCAAGCGADCQWLRQRGMAWLILVAPDDLETETLRALLDGRTAGTQLDLFAGLEALA